MSMGLNCLAGETPLHRLPHLVGGVGPDLHLLLAPLTVGDDALPELVLDLVGLLLVVVEDPALLGGVLTSSIEMVRPDRAAKLKHRSLMPSRLVATSALVWSLASRSTISPICFFFTVSVM